MLKENKGVWTGVIFTVITYIVIITIYTVTTRGMAEVSQKEIENTNKIHREDFKELQKQWIQSTDKLYDELKEIRKEIANIK